MSSHGSAVLVTSRPTWPALQKRAVQIQSINDDFQPHGTWIEEKVAFWRWEVFGISCRPDSQVWHPVWFHKVEFDICLWFIPLPSGSSPSEVFHLQSSIWGCRYPIWCPPWPFSSSLALLPPQKSRLVSSKEPTGLLEQQPRNQGTAPHRDLQTQPVRTNQPPH